MTVSDVARAHESSRQYAYIRVVGESMQLDEMSRRIGLEPDDGWSRGETRLNKPEPYPFSAWHLRSGLDEQQGIGIHIDAILRRAEPYATALKAISNECDVTLQVVRYFQALSLPGLHLEHEVLRQLTSMGASVSVDDHLLGDE